MIAEGSITREELEAFAAANRAVDSGLLSYALKIWSVAIASLMPACAGINYRSKRSGFSRRTFKSETVSEEKWVASRVT